MKKLLALYFLILFGCSEEADLSEIPWRGSSCDEAVGPFDSCPEEITCQLYYATISVRIVDEDGNPVIFQETTLKNLNTGQVLEQEPGFPPENGYIVAEDSMFDQLSREGDCIQLSGFVGGNLVFQYSFLVGHDCCHVELLAGPTTITI